MLFKYESSNFSAFIPKERDMETVKIGDRILCEVKDTHEFESGFRLRFKTQKFIILFNCRDFRGVRIINADETFHDNPLTIEEKYELMNAIHETRNSIVQLNLAIQLRRTLEMLAIVQYAAGLYSDQF